MIKLFVPLYLPEIRDANVRNNPREQQQSSLPGITAGIRTTANNYTSHVHRNNEVSAMYLSGRRERERAYD